MALPIGAIFLTINAWLFSETRLLSASDLPQAYGVVFFGDDYVTVHMVEFGYDGPIRIEGSPDYHAWDRETMVR